MKRCCGTCSRGYPDASSPNKVHCGAGFEEHGGQPIWAVRKSSLAGLLRLLRGDKKGMDCEDMPATDGEDCALWQIENG